MTKSEVTPDEKREIAEGVLTIMVKTIAGTSKAFEREANDYLDTHTFGNKRRSADEGEL